jgi:hypothetical protein
MLKTINATAVPGTPSLIDETLIPIAEAGNQFPVPISRAKIERMIRKGARGIVLETILIGDRRFSSKEAIRRFLENSQGNHDASESAIHKRPKREMMSDDAVEATRVKCKFPPSGHR